MLTQEGILFPTNMIKKNNPLVTLFKFLTGYLEYFRSYNLLIWAEYYEEERLSVQKNRDNYG